MNKKSIICFIILIFLLSRLIPFTSSNKITYNRIIYVDDDGMADYTRIQDAIENASEGDTIFVYCGIYNESMIDINITINLIGEDRYNTIINVNQESDGIYVRSHYVNISGFKIINAFRAGINLDSNTSDNVNISDNLFTSNSHGIHPYYSNKNLIISNNIFINNTNGFTTVCCNYADIHNNLFIGNNWGMSIFQSHFCNIYNNHISTCNKFGIRLYGASVNNYIHHNNFINNSMNAVFVQFSLNNRWDSNYWNSPRYHPYLILGSLGLVFPPWINFDWNPAKEPCDIKNVSF